MRGLSWKQISTHAHVLTSVTGALAAFPVMIQPYKELIEESVVVKMAVKQLVLIADHQRGDHAEEQLVFQVVRGYFALL